MQILGTDKLTHEKWLNLFATTFRHHGKTGRWLFASRHLDPHPDTPGSDAVVIAAILHEANQPPRLVVLREFRVPVGHTMYALPAGLSEPGEPVESTVRREMLEETGLEVTRIKRVTQPLFTSAGLTDESIVMAFVDVRRVDGGKQKLESGEEIEVCLLDHAEVSALSDQPVPIDAKAWWVLYHYRQLGKLE